MTRYTAGEASLPLASIRPNPNNPRKTFDPESLRELAASIKEAGLIQPITVRPVGDAFEIIAGERRYRAHELLGAKTIPARIINATAIDADLAAVIENLQREDVPPLEEAAGLARLVDDGLTPEEIAGKLGLPAFRVRWRLQLLNLEPGLQRLFQAGQLDRQEAFEIARLRSHRDQGKIARAVNTGALRGWKAVRNAVDGILGTVEQIELFTEATPPDPADLRQVDGMERKVDRVIAAVAAGWTDGACVIATKVDPGRARLMADKLDALAKTIRTMALELRNTVAQAPLPIRNRNQRGGQPWAK
jgi:ParB/RepB/Spo0J family partition protein